MLVVECLIISTSATFAPRGIPEFEGRTLIILQTIWAIGASMIALSVAQWMGRRACLILGVAIVAGHNLLDSWWPMSAQLDQQWPLWVSLHSQMSVAIGPFLVVIAYPVIAWIGVMLVGFGISPVFELPARERNAALLRAGATLMVGFIGLRAIGVYGDPNGWQVQPGGATRTVLDFLNTTKYPPSLDFLLMTLGPAAMVLLARGSLDRAYQGRTGHVRPGAVRLLRGPLLSDSHPEHRCSDCFRDSVSARCRRCSSSTPRATA